jgi:hypothetical protein
LQTIESQDGDGRYGLDWIIDDQQLADSLAKELGLSLDAVVLLALREKFERVKRKRIETKPLKSCHVKRPIEDHATML